MPDLKPFKDAPQGIEYMVVQVPYTDRKYGQFLAQMERYLPEWEIQEEDWDDYCTTCLKRILIVNEEREEQLEAFAGDWIFITLDRKILVLCGRDAEILFILLKLGKGEPSV